MNMPSVSRFAMEPVQSLAAVTAAILAGGLGTRLRSVVGDQPKVLARVGDRPFLLHLLDQLADAGVKSVVLCTGYKAEAIARLGGSYRDMTLKYSREAAPLGTAGALRQARPLDSNPVLVLNGDSYCAADLGAMVASHCQSRAPASILLTEVSDSSRYGRVETDADGAVLRFVEKRAGGGSGWINAGIYVLSQKFLKGLPDGSPLSLEHDVFPVWVGRGLRGYRSSGPFIDIGTPESYARAAEFFVQGCVP
jgi:NDP-sugar pyrophosphorylase family protein